VKKPRLHGIQHLLHIPPSAPHILQNPLQAPDETHSRRRISSRAHGKKAVSQLQVGEDAFKVDGDTREALPFAGIASVAVMEEVELDAGEEVNHLQVRAFGGDVHGRDFLPLRFQDTDCGGGREGGRERGRGGWWRRGEWRI
jgi:hypothetical protein